MPNLFCILGVLIFPPVVEIGIAIDNTKTAVQSLPTLEGDFISIGSPFALVFSVTGLVLAVIASLMYIVAALKVKSEKFSTTIFPSAFLSPAILKIGSFPANISMSDRIGHIPPTFNKFDEGLPPLIGSKDAEPLKFENKGLKDHQNMTPYVLFPPDGNHTDGFMYPLGGMEPDNSLPPPYKGLDNTVKDKKFAGSLSLGSNVINEADDNTSTTASEKTPRSPRNKTLKLRKVSEHDLELDQSGSSDMLGKELAQANNGFATLSPRNTKGNSSPNRSPTSPRKTVRINQVSQEQVENSACVNEDTAGKADEKNKKAGKATSNTTHPTKIKTQYLSGIAQLSTKPTTPANGASKHTMPSPKVQKNPQVTQKKIAIPKVQEEELLMK